MSDLFDDVRPIPCLSLWEPWASLMVAGFKIHETRHWPTKVRGLVAIHASKTVDVVGAPDELCEFALGDGWEKTRPVGCVLGVGFLTGCFLTQLLTDPAGHAGLLKGVEACDREAGNYDAGRYGFRFEHFRPLKEPLPLKGSQGFFKWTPPADLERRLGPPVDHLAASRRWNARNL